MEEYFHPSYLCSTSTVWRRGLFQRCFQRLHQPSRTCTITAHHTNTELTHQDEKTAQFRWRGCKGVVGTLLSWLCLLETLPGRTHKCETATPLLTSPTHQSDSGSCPPRRACLSQASEDRHRGKDTEFLRENAVKSPNGLGNPCSQMKLMSVKDTYVPQLWASACLH